MVLIAITSVLMLGFAGLALDYAYVRSAGQSLQTAADASALAGARLVRLDQQSNQFAATRQAAVAIALLNETFKQPVQLDANPANSPTGDIVVGRWDALTRTFTPDTQDPDAVRVTARRTTGSSGGPIELFFGDLFGVSSSDVSRSAVALADLSAEPLVLLLSDGDRALQMNGTSLFDTPGGTVHVNSDEDCAVSLKGGVLSAGTLAVGGTACITNGTLNASLKEGAGQRADPLEALPPPSFSGTPLPTIKGSGNYSPGYYDGIVMNGGTAWLLPGEYVIGSQGIKLHGSARLLGDGVFIYLPKPARLELAGTAFMEVTPPLAGSYEGVTVFQDRKSFLSNTIRGNAQLDLTGTCYLFCGTLELHGTSGSPKVEVGQLISYGLELQGAAEMTVTGLGLKPATAPSPVLLAQ